MKQSNTSESRPVIRFSIKQMLMLVSACCLVSAISVQLEFTLLAGAGAMLIVVLLWLYQIISGQTDVCLSPMRLFRRRVGWAIAFGSVGILCGAVGFFALGEARWWKAAQTPCFIILGLGFIVILGLIVVYVPAMCLGLSFSLARRRTRPFWRDVERIEVLCNATWTFPYAAALLVYVWLWYSLQSFNSLNDGEFSLAVGAIIELTLLTLGIADTKLWWKRRNARRIAKHDVESLTSRSAEGTESDAPI